ncbi:hypothetical protein PENTCL1PPCAC_18899, partial [Pristionchus entomophagus]
LQNGKWLQQKRDRQLLDEDPVSDGWWRVDVIKHNDSRLNVFFQGYWQQVRPFEKSLDNIRSVYVISPCVDHNYVE